MQWSCNEQLVDGCYRVFKDKRDGTYLKMFTGEDKALVQ